MLMQVITGFLTGMGEWSLLILTSQILVVVTNVLILSETLCDKPLQSGYVTIC